MISRRNFFAGAFGSGALAELSFAGQVAEPAAPRRAFRFVHFGDTHVGHTAFSLSSEGYPKALKHVHALKDAPDFILHTGDIITDAFWADRESATAQWKAWRKVMEEHCTLPIRYTLGNHDVNFGWDRGDRSTKFPGKSLALEYTGLTSPTTASITKAGISSFSTTHSPAAGTDFRFCSMTPSWYGSKRI